FREQKPSLAPTVTRIIRDFMYHRLQYFITCAPQLKPLLKSSLVSLTNHQFFSFLFFFLALTMILKTYISDKFGIVQGLDLLDADANSLQEVWALLLPISESPLRCIIYSINYLV